MENLNKQLKYAELIFQELKGEIDEDDKKILHDWINESDENKNLYHKIIDDNSIVNKINAYNKIDKKAAWDKFSKNIEGINKTKTIKLINLLKYAAVISIPLLIGGYFLINNINERNNIAEIQPISPGTQKAILTTSANKKIELGKTEKKQVFNFKKATAVDTSETLTYTKNIEETEKEIEIAYNTLETPRGGEYMLILSDGTKVYLNAETKLVFPEAFTGETREVTLEGEAYFEVIKSKTKPFIVKTNEYDIKVYGTSFNVSAYNSDLNSHTTLVEGSVGISFNNEEIKLIPGEQAVYNKEENELSKNEVDVYVYTAWKDGKFVFSNETLESIMRKLGRWYNFEPDYKDDETRNYHFSGTLKRYDHISEILKMMELTTKIKFEINENTIQVKKVKK